MQNRTHPSVSPGARAGTDERPGRGAPDRTPDAAERTPGRLRSVLAGLGFAALSYGAASLGMLAMRGRGSPEGRWFRRLRKPSFQPPNRVFAPVWTVLYGAVAYSGWRVWRSTAAPGRNRALGLWAAQLALNAAWTPLFFGARRPALALADMAALDAAAGAYTVSAMRVARPAGWAAVPYLAWLGFATALNAGIVVKNR